MRAALILLLLGAASATVDRSEWDAFKAKHGKSYPDLAEDVRRMELYAESKAFVERHMREYAEGKHTYTVALNRFADLTAAERRRLSGGHVTPGQGHGSGPAARGHRVTGGAPAAVDWRDHGLVTEVIDQGQCGSSWAFGATGAMEGAWAKAGNDLVAISAQQLIDCSGKYGNYGCNGGWMNASYEYVRDNGGIETAEQYPYNAKDQECTASGDQLVQVSSWVNIPIGDEDALLDAVGTAGPVATAVDAWLTSFNMYSGGIYYDPNCGVTSRPNHGTLIVGYGEDFWIVKNTWGPDWGEDGYIRIYRNGSDVCGLTSFPSYPVA